MATPHTRVANSAKQKYVGRLDTPRAVQRELARLYCDARRGDLDSGDAYRLSLILGQLCKSMETTTQADEIEALEAVAAQKGLRVA